MTGQVRAAGPYPVELVDLVNRISAYPDWRFYLKEGDYDDGQITQLRLIISLNHTDSYHPDRLRGTAFHFPVPVVVWNREAWQCWLRDRVADVHVHEDGENIAFTYEDGETEFKVRPFAPFHGPGRDQNRQVEVGVDPREQRVSQSGGRYPGWWYRAGLGVHDDETHDREWVGPPSCIPVQLTKEF